jgi:hypothetical protein
MDRPAVIGPARQANHPIHVLDRVVRLLTNPRRGMGRPAGLPIFNQFWRHVRQNCIFLEQTFTFVSSRGTAFGSRDQPALESAGFARRCRRLREGATARERNQQIGGHKS